MIELMPCPFCSSKRLQQRHGYILCANCAATGPLCADQAKARRQWNRRTEQADDDCAEAANAAAEVERGEGLETL